MIFIPIYVGLVWLVVYWLRGRWLALGALLAGCLPLLAVTVVLSISVSGQSPTLSGWVRSLGMFGGIVHVISGVFTAVILAGGLMIAVQKRTFPAPACASCGYDVTAAASPVCPECGAGREAEQGRARGHAVRAA